MGLVLTISYFFEITRTKTEVLPDSHVSSCEVLYVCLRSETVMAGHMREHGGNRHGRSHA